MIPALHQRKNPTAGAPRASGDDPPFLPLRLNEQVCSPRERG